MPILTQESDLYPPELLNGPISDMGERAWFVLYTRSRREKALARHLYARQIPFYLPLLKKTLLYGSRRLLSYVPLFPGYVFLWGAEAERSESLATSCVSRVLPVKDPEALYGQLQRVWRLISADLPLTPESRLAFGSRVRVRQGALMGLEGTVAKRQGETRLVINVDFIQKGASIQIEDYMLEPVG